RIARGFSFLDFARLGWSTTRTLKQAESGEMDPRLELIARASGLLRTHPASLFIDCEFPFIPFTADELRVHVYGRVEVFRRMQHIFHSDLARRASLNPEFLRLMGEGRSRGGHLSSVAKLADALHVNIWLLFV